MGNITTANKIAEVRRRKAAAIANQPSKNDLCRIGLFGQVKVGKSALVHRFVSDLFDDEYDETVENLYPKMIHINEEAVRLEILDAGGDDGLKPIREHSMRTTNGFVLVYSVTDRSSLDKCIEIYQYILRITDKDTVPVLLIGNKTDLAADRVVTKEEGEMIANQYGWKFLETSAKEGINVNEAFNEVAVLGLAAAPRSVNVSLK